MSGALLTRCQVINRRRNDGNKGVTESADLVIRPLHAVQTLTRLRREFQFGIDEILTPIKH